jgi:hypothetical protein
MACNPIWTLEILGVNITFPPHFDLSPGKGEVLQQKNAMSRWTF